MKRPPPTTTYLTGENERRQRKERKEREET